MKMFRILFLVLLTITACPAFADGERYGDNNECFLYYWNNSNRKYLFCGGGQTSCAGKNSKSKHTKHYDFNGYFRMFDGIEWVCCNSTSSSEGKYMRLPTTQSNGDEISEWHNKIEGSVAYYKKIVTVDIQGGGKCTYEARFDGCGTEITKPCTEPTSCADGLVLRNGVCTEPCVGDTDFESKTSNKCVECSTTLYQGSAFVTDIVSSIKKKADGTVDVESTKYADGSYCHKCNKNTEFFDSVSSTCVKKKELKNVDHVAMAKCGMCNNKNSFKGCIECFSGANTSSCKETYKNECFFQD